MAFEQERKAALRILEGISEGTATTADSFTALDEADPVLVYFIVTWLRSRYGPNDPAGDAVLGRLIEITKRYPSVQKKIKEGQSDSVVAWFEDAYSYRNLGAAEFIALVVEKLES